MIINSTADLYSIFISILFGIAVSLVYDIFKSFRYVFKSGNISIIIQDIFFSVIAGMLTFLLLFLRAKGEIRWFILFFELLGFSVMRIYISKYLVKVISKMINIVNKYVFTPIYHFSNFICNKINDFFDKILKKSLKHNG